LLASKVGVSHPTNWKAHSEPLLRAAKIRSWNALQKSAKMCEIDAQDHELRITPTKNCGTSGPDKGYSPIAEQAVVLSTICSDEELGTAVLRTLTLCT
jgi:hypothetical protein